ncbi:hypothetical protein SAMN06265795_12615 [Noviherbaspirillum humi]|uniref:HEPN domain-containing protein n=1 Tax=Noviherbaspirillum humi TaxID=1688639 RepID=A0A239LTP0_9BURK|nr:hypothetical protein [Noviherbaspirillum humi]SNT33322.1 hypothetical protein SAMN06265795_12615 [Noviherbaspirillum humi]
MHPQLLLSKRLFTEGTEFAKRPDAVSCGLAISLFQDAVELFIWALIKERSINVKEQSPFTTNLDAIEKAGLVLSDRAKIQELNKARVNFKHYGNLPAPDEARKFEIYSRDFLRTGISEHFGYDFDSISLVDLVSDAEARTHLQAAEKLLSLGNFQDSLKELGIAKWILFNHLNQYIPRVSTSLSYADRVLTKANLGTRVEVFSYIADYLSVLREISLVTLLRIPFDDYTFLRTILPNTSRSESGKWHTVFTNGYVQSEADCNRCISILVELSIRLESVV